MLKPIKIERPKKNTRKVTRRAFWERVTDVKYAQLIELSKTDSLLAARLSMINGAEYVGLDDEKLNSAFNDMQEAGMFTQEDSDRIFADAQPHEEPNI